MSTAKYSHVLFDLDGTLIDSAPAILASFRQAFETTGVAPARSIDEDIIGPPLMEALALLCDSTDPALLERLAAAFKAGYDTSGYRATQAYAGVGEMLRELRAGGQRLSIATNKRILPTRLILDHLGWRDLFEAVYALDLFEPRLPHKAAMVGRLLADLAAGAGRAVYVGDREEDGLAAEANGLPFIAATWGYGSLEAAQLAPGWRVAERPAALPALLRQD